ncbi:glycosyltransferase [bacterium]|nr:glycosyltransferase [bacterium]
MIWLPLLGETESALLELALVGGVALLATTLLDRRRTFDRGLLFFGCFVLAGRYMWWRITQTLAPPGLTADFLASASLLALEGSALLGSLSAFVILSRTSDRSAEVDRNLGWWGSAAPPRVAILIATYNEEQEVLERTIVGALALRHPAKEVFVLDDGGRDWLGAYCQLLGVHHITRPDNTGAKAGNMNHALKLLAARPDPPDFVAVLDADFVPHRGFISRSLALFRDPKVGLVQTPQHFFNPDPIQHNLGLNRAYPDEQRFFFDHMQPSRDAWGVAFCCGTSSVARFSALRQIGWFSTDSVTEDFMVTLVLQEAGWKTAYLNEPLTEGLAPEGLKEYITQRARWCLGMMQIARSRVGPFARDRLRLRDRWSVLDSVLYWVTTFSFRIAALIYPLLYWFFNVTVVDATVPDVIRYFGTYYLWVLVALNFISGGVVLPILTDVSQLLGALPICRAAFTGLVRPKGHPFRVTAKGGERSRIIVQWRLMSQFVVLLALTLAGLLIGLVDDRFAYYDAGDGKAIVLFWTLYNVVLLAVTCLVCVELPRGEEHVADQPERGELRLPDGTRHQIWLVGLTLNEVRIRGHVLQAGAPGRVAIPEVGEVEFLTIANTADGARLLLKTDAAQRAILIARLHADGDAPGIVQVRFADLALGLARRLSVSVWRR